MMAPVISSNKGIFVTRKIYFMDRSKLNAHEQRVYDLIKEKTDIANKRFAQGGIIPDDLMPASGDNANRPEKILTDYDFAKGKLSAEGEGELMSPSEEILSFKPRQQSVDKILAHAELRRYQRLCWQLAGVLTASLLLDTVLIIWLIRLGSWKEMVKTFANGFAYDDLQNRTHMWSSAPEIGFLQRCRTHLKSILNIWPPCLQ